MNLNHESYLCTCISLKSAFHAISVHGDTIQMNLFYAFSVNSHCMVQYDSSKVYLIGGYQSGRDNSETSKKTWIIDPTNGFVINRGEAYLMRTIRI